MAESSQKFIGRNRAPRVHITYDIETYGSEKAVEIPFIMGVLADLAGKSTELKPVDERKFLEIDVDNFDDRLKAIAPKVSFRVDDVLTSDEDKGPDEEKKELAVNITFQSMEDFTPGAIAKNVDGLKELYEARRQLDALERYMDGKPEAETFLGNILENTEFLKAIEVPPASEQADTEKKPTEGD